MKIDLVYPSSTCGSENYSSEAPLGPVALYTSLPLIYRENTRFLDSTVLIQEEIEKELINRKADIVAISCTTYNYPNALRVAEIAKNNGSFVVMGGIHITHLRDVILNKMQKGERPIDFLVTGYGEPAFEPLLKAIESGKGFFEIPNLSFINNGEIVINHQINPRFGNDPLIFPMDYSEIDFNLYSEKFHPFGNLSDAKVPGSIFTQRGCTYSGSKKCSFCSIEKINVHRTIDLFEQDLTNLISHYNVDQIRITDADFTVNKHHMSQIADAAERVYDKTGIRPVVHCFARADEIDEQRITHLKKLNVVSLFIGYESGSNKMLHSMQKGMTKDQNLQATKLLKKHGIDVICGGLVLGAEGENEDTLQETLLFVKELTKIGNTVSLVATPLIPLPGSLCFNELLKKLRNLNLVKYQELLNSDIFSIEELIELWNKYFCNVPLKRIIQVCKDIENLIPAGIKLISLY